MLLIDIHQLDVIFAESIVVGALEHEIHNIRCVLSLDRQNVFVLSASQNLGKGVEVDAQSNVTVATKGRERLGFKHHRYEGDVGVVHGLQSDAGIIAVEITILDKIFDCIDNLERYQIGKDLDCMMSTVPSSAILPALNVLPTLWPIVSCELQSLGAADHILLQARSTFYREVSGKEEDAWI